MGDVMTMVQADKPLSEDAIQLLIDIWDDKEPGYDMEPYELSSADDKRERLEGADGVTEEDLQDLSDDVAAGQELQRAAMAVIRPSTVVRGGLALVLTNNGRVRASKEHDDEMLRRELYMGDED